MKISKKTIFAVLVTTIIIITVATILITTTRSVKTIPEKVVYQCHGEYGNCVVALKNVTDFDWDRVYFFEAGFGLENIENIIKIPFPFSYDSNRIFMFIRGNNIAYSESEYVTPDNLDDSVLIDYEESAMYWMGNNKMRFRVKKILEGNESRIYLIPADATWDTVDKT